MMGPGAVNVGSGADPGSPGFVAGTTSAPRVVRVIANDALRVDPDVVVGPAPDVATHKEATPEIADIGMMQT
jgi:hypothetical protein